MLTALGAHVREALGAEYKDGIRFIDGRKLLRGSPIG